MSLPRVVISGIGVLAANGASARLFASALREGRGGIRTIRRFDPGWPFRQAGEVDFESSQPQLDRVSQLGVEAAVQAIADAGLPPQGPWPRGTGLSVGTSRGPAMALEEFLAPDAAGRREALLDEIPFFSIARNIARTIGLSGPLSTVTMACVSSSVAIGRAFDRIRRGRSRMMIAGGADALTNLSFSGFSVLRAMTRTLCRPFDRGRDGLVLGEGAGMLVLEDLEHARERGARIYAEICGWGSAGDAHHATSPHPAGRGLASAIRGALEQAGLNPSDVQHVNLHGTGTRANDPAESHAVRDVFGSLCESLPVNSLKPMIGHTLGAAGVLELAGSVLAMVGGFIPPTLNYTDRDPDCALEVVSGQSREQRTATILSTKAAFGGANVAIVASRL